MSVVFLRRRKLGRTSCKEVSRLMRHESSVVRNDVDLINRLQGIGPDDFVVRWGTTSNLPVRQNQILNTAEAIHRVNDKTGFRRLCMVYEQEHGVKLVPKTWFGCYDEGFYEEAYNDVGPSSQKFPLIVRPSRHSQGRNLHLCNTFEAVQAACNRYPEGGYYISEYVPKVAEYRVFIVQGRAVWVAQKTPADPTSIAWNVAQGGRFDVTPWGEWPLKAVKNAIIGFNLSGLDFGGVDIMLDAQGNSYILEINSAPSMTSPYRQECTAKAFDWIVEHGKATIPLIEAKGGYRKFIHPAVCEDALLVGV